MTKSASRPYRKGKRAEAEAETRLRITEAAVELHGTVGPANTTVTEVARLAGVSRMTVYNHFPTDVELFTACSTHWATQNPFPDPSTWTGIADPAERLGHAMAELYAWYGLKQAMLGNVLRDVPVVPALAEVMEVLWSMFMDGAVHVLSEGWHSRDVEAGTEAGDAEAADAEAIRATVRLAVDFNTWQVLTASGLDDAVAAALMARMVHGVASPK
jgi:AcrR family transcriptional regulator